MVKAVDAMAVPSGPQARHTQGTSSNRAKIFEAMAVDGRTEPEQRFDQPQ